jgi:hypothetical protein
MLTCLTAVLKKGNSDCKLYLEGSERHPALFLWVVAHKLPIKNAFVAFYEVLFLNLDMVTVTVTVTWVCMHKNMRRTRA